MQKKRFLLDFLVISAIVFSLSIVILAFEWYLPTADVQVGTLLYGVNIKHSVFLYIAVIISFFIYGWSLRKWFIKKNFESRDRSLNHIIVVFLPIFIVGLIHLIIISFLNLPELNMYARFSSIFLEVLQFVAVSTILGILFYSIIEKRISKLLRRDSLEVKQDGLGMALIPTQLRQNSRKFGILLSTGIAGAILLVNLILIIVYPSVKAASIEAKLDFFYPNFWYSYDPADGLAQEYLKRTSIPSNIVFDWKLAQAILSIVVICITILVLLTKGEEREINKPPKSETLNEDITVENQDDIAFRILNPETKNLEYVPPKFIETKPSKKYTQLFSRVDQSSFIPLMKLTVLGVFTVLFFVIIFQNTGALGQISEVNDSYSNYIHLTQSIWEGFGEEFMFRVILFGLPLFVINGFLFSIKKMYEYRSKTKTEKKDKSFFERYVQKKQLKNPLFYLSGGWRKIDLVTIILMIFSSLSFAYAQAPYGWNPWKMTYTFILGLIYSYAYCKYGLHTAILINISTEILLNLVFVSGNGLILNSPFLVFTCLIFGSIMFLNLISLVLSKVFKLGIKLSN